MSISGNLRTMELSELLQWLSQGGKTGTLIIDNGQHNKRIYFEDGNIVASGSTQPSEQLGHFLVSHGYINEHELTKAIEMQEETGMLIGKILVTIGGISEEELRQLLVHKTEESIYDMFSWDEGEFRFVDNDRLTRGMIPLALDVAALTLQGMNRLDEWNRIKRVIPSGGAVPVLVGEIDDNSLSMVERRILDQIDDDRTIHEIALETHSNEYLVSRIVFRQQQKGRVKVVVPRGESAKPAAAEPEPAEPQESSTELIVDAGHILGLAGGFVDEGDFPSALRHMRAARSLEPDNRKILDGYKECEEHIKEALVNDGLDMKSTPILERSVEELTSLKLSPEEGFLLTRIDGTSSIESLLKISPLERLEAQLVFYKLLKGGHIKLEPTN